LFSDKPLAYGLVDAGGVRSLLEDNRVARIAEAAELSLIRPITVAAVLPKTSSDATWGLKRLNVPTMWAHGYDGTGVIVGHLDTGVDGTHPALAGAISDFAEFDFSGNQVQATVPHDSGEHGTHTAGTIVGRLTERGAFGVAPGARLASALVIEGGQVIPRILAGMEWLVSKKVRILSMSAGLRGTTDAFQEIVNALRNNGVLPIFAVAMRAWIRVDRPAITQMCCQLALVPKTVRFRIFHPVKNSRAPKILSCPTLSLPASECCHPYQQANLRSWMEPPWLPRMSPGWQPCFCKRSLQRRPMRLRPQF